MKKLVIKKKEVGKVEETEEIPEERLVAVEIDEEGAFRLDGESRSLERRNTGEFAGKAIYLSSSFNYELGKDSEGSVCLVPLKKEEEPNV